VADDAGPLDLSEWLEAGGRRKVERLVRSKDEELA
jgi:hypothetical protein